jgi:hypothetical protein
MASDLTGRRTSAEWRFDVIQALELNHLPRTMTDAWAGYRLHLQQRAMLTVTNAKMKHDLRIRQANNYY